MLYHKSLPSTGENKYQVWVQVGCLDRGRQKKEKTFEEKRTRDHTMCGESNPGRHIHSPYLH